jgi:hypothetical protein
MKMGLHTLLESGNSWQWEFLEVCWKFPGKFPDFACFVPKGARTTGCLFFFPALYFLVQSHEPYVDDARAPLFSVPGLRPTCQNIRTSTVYVE